MLIGAYRTFSSTAAATAAAARGALAGRRCGRASPARCAPRPCLRRYRRNANALVPLLSRKCVGSTPPSAGRGAHGDATPRSRAEPEKRLVELGDEGLPV